VKSSKGFRSDLFYAIGFIILLASTSGSGFLCGFMCHAVRCSPRKKVLMKVTAYCPCSKCCGKWADGITASGHVIRKNDLFCAASDNIPFGTMVSIPGYGTVPVLDRCRQRNTLDVFFDEHDEAVRWGVRWLEVTWDRK